MIDTLIKSDNRAYQTTAHGLGRGRARRHGSHGESSLQQATEKPAHFARQRLLRRGSSSHKTEELATLTFGPHACPRSSQAPPGRTGTAVPVAPRWRPTAPRWRASAPSRSAQATSGDRAARGARWRPVGAAPAPGDAPLASVGASRLAANACRTRAHTDRPVPWRPTGARRRLAAASSHRKVWYGLPRPRVAKRHAWGAAES